ncbi:hypothetical protein RD792_011342 [Penstemon davidsonii]|uniref:Uncharacterized protein n=1 Tax=Penstemon davidsonii TaxID=160366 RepID=A0ABR0D4B7_9LAMI|nr:hypothetical protein RD792_011342 [Penstemon davidsonii]
MSDSTSLEVSLVDDMKSYARGNGDRNGREEYHLTPKDGNIPSDVMLLNRTPLKLMETFDSHAINPRLVDDTLPVRVAHDLIVFVTLRGFIAPACA